MKIKLTLLCTTFHVAPAEDSHNMTDQQTKLFPVPSCI
jgi:hypothetical protein